MNICYCLNQKNKYLLYISIKSFQKYHPNAKFYILYNGEDSLNVNATIIKPDMRLITNEFNSDLCGFRHVSIECFLRLLIPKYVKEDKVLYVDTDTLCLGNIDDFYNMDFEDNYFIGVRGISYSDEQAKMLEIPYYINSGVLLMNNKALKENDYWQHIKNTWRGSLGKQEPYSADETVINYCFHKKIKLASEEYNYCYNRDYGNRAINNPKIIHFVGCNKSAMLEYKYEYKNSNNKRN